MLQRWDMQKVRGINNGQPKKKPNVAVRAPTRSCRKLADISPLLHRDEQRDAHEFYIALFSSLLSKSIVK